MKHFGSVFVEGIVPKIKYKGALTKNLDPDYGDYEDDKVKTYVYFFGIPYAKPPIKKKRFEPPEPYERGLTQKYWSYNATKKKPNHCLQPLDRASAAFIGSEDCLYLNIYLPKKPKYIFIPLPVLVYFHGGGLFSGSGNYEYATPDSIVKENIIFVTVNYRLGPFGFLNMHAEHCKGNAGLKDQVMALKWIRDNIEAFRGDPNNVTICGESAGGTCVNFHLISPLSKGLFHKAIVQSGGIYCPWGFKGHQREMMRHFKSYQDHEGASRDKVVRELKSLGPRALAKLDREIKEHEFYALRKMEIHLGPSFENFKEGAFIPPGEKIEELMMKAERNIPIMAGLTAKEGYMTYCSHFQHFDMNWVKQDVHFIQFLMVNRWKKESALQKFNLIRTAYFPKLYRMTNFEIAECMADFCTDLWFSRFYDNFKFANPEEGKASDLYVYKFNFMTEINPTLAIRGPMQGAGHGDDTAYLFPPKNTRKVFKPFSQDVRKKIKTMCSLWASFCRTGKPTCPFYEDFEWTPHTEENPCFLNIDEGMKMTNERLFQLRWRYFNGMYGEADRVTSPKFLPRTPGCDVATQDDWQTAQSSDAGTSSDYCCDRSEISKSRREQSVPSTSSVSTEPGGRLRVPVIGSEPSSSTSSGITHALRNLFSSR